MRPSMPYLLLCAILFLCGCRTYLPAHGQRESLVLRTVASEGGDVTYSLYSSGESSPKIHRTRVVRT